MSIFVTIITTSLKLIIYWTLDYTLDYIFNIVSLNENWFLYFIHLKNVIIIIKKVINTIFWIFKKKKKMLDQANNNINKNINIKMKFLLTIIKNCKKSNDCVVIIQLVYIKLKDYNFKYLNFFMSFKTLLFYYFINFFFLMIIIYL